MLHFKLSPAFILAAQIYCQMFFFLFLPSQSVEKNEYDSRSE